MNQALRLWCVLVLAAIPLRGVCADMSPEMYQLGVEARRNFETDSTQATRGPECKDDCFRLANEAWREMLKAQAVDRVVIRPLVDSAKFALSSLGIPNVAMSTYDVINCYLDESTPAGFKACMIKTALSLAVGEGLQKGANWENLSGALAGLAWDKAYTQIGQAVDGYQAQNEFATYTASRDCKVDVSMSWNKHRQPGANGGRIFVLFNFYDCRCPTPSSTKSGSLSFYIPVHLAPAGNNEPGWAAGDPEEYKLRSSCCSGSTDDRMHVYDRNFKWQGVEKVSDEETPPPPPPLPPVTPPPVNPPHPPPVTPPPPPPQWGEQNPCPECQPFLDLALKHQAQARELQTQMDEQQRKLDTNRQRQQATRGRIERLQRELAGKVGDGGSSFDPETGVTVNAWTQPDGTVKVTVTDKDGNVVNEYTRPRRDTKKIREDLENEQTELKRLEEEASALQAEMDRLRQGRATQLKLEQDARTALADCVRVHCLGGVAIGEEPPKPKVCVFPAPQSVQIGSRAEYGEKSVEQKAKEKVKGLLGGLVSSAIGGSSDRGGMVRSGSGDGPELMRNPVKHRQLFASAGGTAIQAGMAHDRKGGEIVSVNVKESPSKGVVHTISRETLDENCDPHYKMPTDYWMYELWAEWSLKVSWTKDTYVNNQHVKHEQGGWQDSGKTMLGSGIFDPAKDTPLTAWGQLGFKRAFAGPRDIGASFPASRPGVPERYIVQVSEPQNDPVTTTPFALYPVIGPDGRIEFTDKQPDWSAMQ